jgi:hypothetical protein
MEVPNIGLSAAAFIILFTCSPTLAWTGSFLLHAHIALV